jgi:hypothetical protein
VAGEHDGFATLTPGLRLRHEGGGRWRVGDVEYRTDDLRYSVSWKGYCFADEAERDAWSGHHDDLTLDAILDRLVADLVDRGRIDTRPGDVELGRLLIDEHIRFPAPAPAG